MVSNGIATVIYHDTCSKLKWLSFKLSALLTGSGTRCINNNCNNAHCVPSFSVISGQTTCKNGLGRVLYERLPNQQLQGYDDDVVRDTAPPFRVLEKCQDLCLRDRTGTNNLVRTCTSFDFQPGSRITAFGGNMEYEESLCYLTSEQAGPEGIGSLMLVPNSVHFNEICLTCK